jgi:hypothetical protein
MKKLNIGCFIFYFSIIALSLNACKHEPDSIAIADQKADPICFESAVLPIYQSYCAKAGCHNLSTAANGYKLNNFDNIISKGLLPGNALDSKIYKVMFESGAEKMPPVGNTDLNDSQKIIIRQWINQGALNTTNCVALCDTTTFNYAGNIKPILNTFCNGCHSGINPQGDIDLSTYTLLKEYIDNNPESFIGSIEHTAGYAAMPKTAAKLTNCNIVKLKKWINSGSPNN